MYAADISSFSLSTALIPKFGANDGEPLRLRVEKQLVPPCKYARYSTSNRNVLTPFVHDL
jgi:hypothetical protein